MSRRRRVNGTYEGHVRVRRLAVAISVGARRRRRGRWAATRESEGIECFSRESSEKLSRVSTWLPSSGGPQSSDYSSHPRSSARPSSMTNWRRSDCWCCYCCCGGCCTCRARPVRGLALEWWRTTSASRRRMSVFVLENESNGTSSM